jgi:hypothetical protein
MEISMFFAQLRELGMAREATEMLPHLTAG